MNTQICPDCGTNYLIQHKIVDEKDMGIWFHYKELEDGDYTCENGHRFLVRWDESKNQFEIN